MPRGPGDGDAGDRDQADRRNERELAAPNVLAEQLAKYDEREGTT